MSVIDNIRLTFLYIEFYSMGKTWVYPESYIPYNIFRYIVKGKAEFCIDGEEIIVKENQIVYIPQGCRMSCRALSESFEFYSLRFMQIPLHRITDSASNGSVFPVVTEHFSASSDHAFL